MQSYHHLRLAKLVCYTSWGDFFQGINLWHTGLHLAKYSHFLGPGRPGDDTSVWAGKPSNIETFWGQYQRDQVHQMSPFVW